MSITTFTQTTQLSDSAAKVLKQTFIVVAIMMTITSVVTTAAMTLYLPPAIVLASIVGQFIILFTLNKFKDRFAGLVLLSLFSVLFGITLSLTLRYTISTYSNGELIIAQAAVMTLVALIGCYAYVSISQKNFSGWGMMLTNATLLAIFAGVFCFFFPSDFLEIILSAFGVLLFTGWLLYDLSRVIHGEEKNYIVAAINIYIDIMGLFIKLIKLLSQLNGNRR